MNVKIDTKEKFTVVTPSGPSITANMTGEMRELLLANLQNPVPHLILNFKQVEQMEPEVANTLSEIQHLYYEKNYSFIVCELRKNVEDQLDQLNILELMNTTPTESEAWDIVQMEEIERELLNDDD